MDIYEEIAKAAMNFMKKAAGSTAGMWRTGSRPRAS